MDRVSGVWGPRGWGLWSRDEVKNVPCISKKGKVHCLPSVTGYLAQS